jgi:hypothetical protein
MARILEAEITSHYTRNCRIMKINWKTVEWCTDGRQAFVFDALFIFSIEPKISRTKKKRTSVYQSFTLPSSSLVRVVMETLSFTWVIQEIVLFDWLSLVNQTSLWTVLRYKRDRTTQQNNKRGRYLISLLNTNSWRYYKTRLLLQMSFKLKGRRP